MKSFRAARGSLRRIHGCQSQFHARHIQSQAFHPSLFNRPALGRVEAHRTIVPSALYSTNRSLADTLAEELQQIYAEAKDEFEIATESTEARAIYAAEDRQAARDELVKLQEAYQRALEGEAGEELRKRPIGQRIRELEAAIEALNQADYED